jgi:RTX calcium-binding nonapeptide repeat (4 copies)
MSQTAKQTGTVIAAAPVRELPLANPVVTRAQSRTTKRQLNGDEAEVVVAQADNVIPAQAVLMSQVTGEPLGAPGAQVTQVAERCPVTEPGVADACGLSGAADAHAAAGSPLWALALLPLLGAGGGGGGDKVIGSTIDTTPLPNGPEITKINGIPSVSHPIDNKNPIGELLEFTSNKDKTGSKYTIIKVEDLSGNIAPQKAVSEPNSPEKSIDFATYTDTATDPWFYLDENTGIIYLTAAGSAAHCIGNGFTVTVQVESTSDSTPPASTSMTFIVEPPNNGIAAHTFFSQGDDYTTTDPKLEGQYDILAVATQGTVTELTFIGPYDSLSPVTHRDMAILIGNNDYRITGQYDVNHFEYLKFSNQVSIFGYDLHHGNIIHDLNPNESETYTLQAYYTLPQADESIAGTPCNDVLVGNFTDPSGNVIDGDTGNDLIFSAWIEIPENSQGLAPNETFNGKDGNDLLIGGWGDDLLQGGNGNDVLVGGHGLNTLWGGTGADIFVFNASETAGNADIVKDFDTAQGDKIWLDSTIFPNETDVHFNEISGELSYITNNISVVFAHLKGVGLTEESVRAAVIIA